MEWEVWRMLLLGWNFRKSTTNRKDEKSMTVNDQNQEIALKQVILDKLAEIFRITGQEVLYMAYQPDTELVKVMYYSGATQLINVAYDSKAAMVYDVVNHVKM